MTGSKTEDIKTLATLSKRRLTFLFESVIRSYNYRLWCSNSICTLMLSTKYTDKTSSNSRNDLGIFEFFTAIPHI